MNYMYATQIKTRLIDHFLNKSNDITAIINELPYYNSSRFIDLTFLGKKHLHTIEIKSEKDSLLRLKGQVKDLLAISDYVSVAVSESHIADITQILPSKVGIISVSKEKVTTVRKPQKNSDFKEYVLLTLLPKKLVMEIAKSYKLECKSNISVDELRKKVSQKAHVKSLHKLVIEFLAKKHQEKLILFKNEKENPSTKYDLQLLNNRFNGSIYSL